MGTMFLVITTDETTAKIYTIELTLEFALMFPTAAAFQKQIDETASLTRLDIQRDTNPTQVGQIVFDALKNKWDNEPERTLFMVILTVNDEGKVYLIRDWHEYSRHFPDDATMFAHTAGSIVTLRINNATDADSVVELSNPARAKQIVRLHLTEKLGPGGGGDPP